VATEWVKYDNLVMKLAAVHAQVAQLSKAVEEERQRILGTQKAVVEAEKPKGKKNKRKRYNIVDVFKDYPDGARVGTIADALDITESGARSRITNAFVKGTLEKYSRGLYGLPRRRMTSKEEH